MDFEYTDEQRMFRKLAHDFVERVVLPNAREIDRQDRFPVEWLKEMASLGFLGLTVPEKYGGLGVDRICYCVVIEEMARGPAPAWAIVGQQNSFANMPVLEWGTEAQRTKYIPRMVKGEMVGAVGSTEPNHGSDAAGMETMAERNSKGWTINGTKMFITSGTYADVVTSAAQTDRSLGHKGIVAFMVEKDHPGFTSKKIAGKMGMKGMGLSELLFQDCHILEQNMLGGVGDGLKVLMSAMDDARLVIGAACSGLCQACIDASVNYAQERFQFGKPIGNFQLVQAMIADMIVETEAARLLTYRAAKLMDQGQRGRVETSHCKLYASEVAQRVTYNAVQVHGGYGYIDEFPIERFFRDARAMTIFEGTSEIHRLIIGKHATGISSFR